MTIILNILHYLEVSSGDLVTTTSRFEPSLAYTYMMDDINLVSEYFCLKNTADEV